MKAFKLLQTIFKNHFLQLLPLILFLKHKKKQIFFESSEVPLENLQEIENFDQVDKENIIPSIL